MQGDNEFDGKYYQLKDARNEPKGPQKPHPPICIGGSGEKRTLPLTARYADHWNFAGGPPEEFAHKRDVLRCPLRGHRARPQGDHAVARTFGWSPTSTTTRRSTTRLRWARRVWTSRSSTCRRRTPRRAGTVGRDDQGLGAANGVVSGLWAWRVEPDQVVRPGDHAGLDLVLRPVANVGEPDTDVQLVFYLWLRVLIQSSALVMAPPRMPRPVSATQ